MTLDKKHYHKYFHQTVVNILYKIKIKVSLKLQAFPSRVKQKEEERMCSAPAERLYSHLANEQDTTGPGQSPAQDIFF